MRKVLIVNEVGGADLMEKATFEPRLEHRKGVKRRLQDEGTVNAVQKLRQERPASTQRGRGDQGN